MTAAGSSPGVSAQPRTPPTAAEDASDGEAGRSGELRAVPDGDRLEQIEDLARVLDPRAWLPADNESLRLDRELRQTKARLQADRALVAGFRREAEDPEPVPVDVAVELASLRFLSARYRAREEHARERCWGVSSDALAWFAVGWADEPKGSQYPADESDLAACERTYAMAPVFLQQRMEPILEKYRAAFRGGEQQ